LKYETTHEMRRREWGETPAGQGFEVIRAPKKAARKLAGFLPKSAQISEISETKKDSV